MSKEEITEKRIYFREYDDSENLFVKQNKEYTEEYAMKFSHDPLRRSMRNLIVKNSIEFSEKYHISLSIKEKEHFLFVAFAFGEYMYLDSLRPLILVCEDVFITHGDDRTIVELLFCTDEMTLNE